MQQTENTVQELKPASDQDKDDDDKTVNKGNETSLTERNWPAIERMLKLQIDKYQDGKPLAKGLTYEDLEDIFWMLGCMVSCCHLGCHCSLSCNASINWFK